MSRQFRMERIVSEREGQNIFQGSAINPKTGCNSAVFLSSDDDVDVEESEGSGGLKVEPETPYALQARPLSRKSARFSNENHNDVKVQNWVDMKVEKENNIVENKPIKQKKRKDKNTKNKKGSQGKKLKNKKETISERFSDDDKIIEGTRHLMSQVEKKFTILENEKNSRYKRLLQELNIFVSQHEKEMIGRGHSLNLEPVNVNMNEFHDWLDNVEKGKFNKNEVSDKYRLSEDMFSDIFEKTKKRKSTKKIVKAKKVVGNLKEENKEEVPLEVWNEEVLNSWRAPIIQEEEVYDESVIRVRPIDKKDKSYLIK